MNISWSLDAQLLKIEDCAICMLHLRHNKHGLTGQTCKQSPAYSKAQHDLTGNILSTITFHNWNSSMNAVIFRLLKD